MLRFYSSTLILLPLIIAVGLVGLFYDYQISHGIVLSLLVAGGVSILFDWKWWKKDLSPLLVIKEKNTYYLSLLCFFIIMMGVVDLSYNGITYLNPENYAKLDSITALIRHFSSLCWILAPLAIFLPLNKFFKFSFLIWAFLFPLLVMDRNRFLLSSFSLVTSLIYLGIQFKNLRRKILISACALFVGILISFSYLGQRRTGESYIYALYGEFSGAIPHSGYCSPPKKLPIKKEVQELSPYFQWIFLYASTPIFNLSIQDDCQIKDSSLLKAQVIPQWKKSNIVGTPYLVNLALNVGTEYLPFYLAFGYLGVIFALVLQFLILRWSFTNILKTGSIFDYLIFLRFSYCSLMAGFAPQFFIWTNLGFVIVIYCVKLLSYSKLGNWFQIKLAPKELRWLSSRYSDLSSLMTRQLSSSHK